MFTRIFAPVKKVNNVYNRVTGGIFRLKSPFAPGLHGVLSGLGMEGGGAVGQIVAQFMSPPPTPGYPHNSHYSTMGSRSKKRSP